MILKPNDQNNIDIRQSISNSDEAFFNSFIQYDLHVMAFPFDNDLKIIFSKLFKEIYKELSESNQLKETYVDIKEKFNQLCQENFWTNNPQIFKVLKNNFKTKPYNFKNNLKLAIKAFLEPISYQVFSKSSGADKGTKIYLESRKDEFLRLIKNQFSKIKNIKNKIERFVKEIVEEYLKENTTRISISDLTIIKQRINMIQKSDIWNNNFFEIKNALKNIFNLNRPLTTEIFQVSLKNFRDKLKTWIRRVINYNKPENITYWELKQDLLDIWKRRYTVNREQHEVKKVLKIAPIISWKIAKKIPNLENAANVIPTLEELDQLIIGMKSSLSNCGINLNDIKTSGILEYDDDSNNNNRYKRGNIVFSIYLKNSIRFFSQNLSTKFAENISLNERITRTINHRLIKHLNSFLVTQKFHLMDEMDLQSLISPGLTLKQIRNFEDENTNSYIELTWQKLKTWLFPDINIEEINFKNDIKNAQDNDRSITFKYYLKLEHSEKRKFSQLIVKAFDNDSNEFIYSTDLLKKFGKETKEYRTLLDKIATRISANDIDWSSIMSKIWLNQFLGRNLNLINDINQDRFFARVGRNNILTANSSEKYKNQIKKFNDFRKNSGLTQEDSFKLKFTVEIHKNPTGNEYLALLLNFADEGLPNNMRRKKTIFLKPLSSLSIAKRISKGPYTKYQNFSYDKINSYLEVINAINIYKLSHLKKTFLFGQFFSPESADQPFFPKLGKPLDFNKFKMKKNGKIISFQEIINYIKSQGFENVQVSNVKMGGAKNNRQGVDITFSTSYYIFDANSQNKETATYTIFLPIEIKGVEPEYIESQKQKVVDFVMKNWQKDEKFQFKPIKYEYSRSNFLRAIDSSYDLFKENGKYKGNVSKESVDYMTEYYLEKLKFLLDPRTNMKNLRKLYESQEIPKDVLEMNRDKEISSIFSRIFKTKGWENSRKLRQKIKKLIESKNLMKLAKNSSKGIQKLLTNSFRQINKINKKVKYVYFGSGIALAVSSVLLLSNAISKFKISKKAKKMNINLKSSRIAIRASSILAVLTLLGSVAMNVIFFIVEKGF